MTEQSTTARLRDAMSEAEAIQTQAFRDFARWCDARHPDRSDMEALAEEYAQDCEAGAWVPQPPEDV